LEGKLVEMHHANNLINADLAKARDELSSYAADVAEMHKSDDLERRIRNRTTEPAPPVEQRVIIGKRRVAESWKAPTKCIESQ
jgi:hypothetical protein